MGSEMCIRDSIATPNTAVVGASGIVYGIMAAVLVVERSSGKDPWNEGLGTLIIVNIVLSFVIPGISVGGHLGGLTGGLIGGWIAGDQRQRSISRILAGFPIAALLGFALGLVAAKTWLDQSYKNYDSLHRRFNYQFPITGCAYLSCSGQASSQGKAPSR